ncbi:hypothetical protein C8Q79DRAFT_1028342 [Trametes meyenii]|nr:hypothetical protein C8Q79DRAFT_1028342 [Trametes meyenii]
MYPADPTFVDNTDAQLTYADPAKAQQTLPNAYGGTLAVTTEPGAEFQLIFFGRIVQIYGALIPSPATALPRAQYTIDDDPEAEFVPSTSSIQTGVEFFISTLLPITFHTLTVKVLNASADAPFLFDCVVYGFLDTSEDPNPPNATSSAVMSMPALSMVSSSSSTASATGVPSKVSSPTATASGSSRPFPVALVVGAVVAGAAFFALLIAGTYCAYARRRKHSEGDRESIEPADAPEPQGIDHTGLGEKGLREPTPRPSWSQPESGERWPFTQDMTEYPYSVPPTLSGTVPAAKTGLPSSALHPAVPGDTVPLDGKDARVMSGQAGSSAVIPSREDGEAGKIGLGEGLPPYAP